MECKVKIWGSRGSRAVPGRDTLVYGGNTACVEVRFGQHQMIIDAGSGICELMKDISFLGQAKKADLFISHMHWDHILGLPFFKPLYQSDNVFCIHGVNGRSYDFESALRNVMRDPNFPISFDDLKSRNIIKTHEPGASFNLQDVWKEVTEGAYRTPDIRVDTMPNQHPNGGSFYKFSCDGRTVCYASDTECAPEKPEFIDSLVRFVQGVDLLIMDANYTRDEYEGRVGGFSKKGWGHACWEDCVMVAQRADVKKLCLFHHDAARTDREQALIEKAAQLKFGATIAAREGLELVL
ncbi:MBL fold metallo-hydrolase [uncultured Anaeromusa sp.]|uniref:MBL fold metallo-hydrolase n=1 Tax=uncultured Anaeromusa sp. TaxID=673273 RepID=UPI0029C65ECB|nr:MBL fold metallo-hydrolase [uncultured Anaeromusa sp.]